MDEAKLAEIERDNAARRGGAKGWLVLGPQGAAELIAAAREALTLRRLIEEHNAGCAAECAARSSEAGGYAGICAAHRRTARGCCPDCPQRDAIPLP